MNTWRASKSAKTCRKSRRASSANRRQQPHLLRRRRGGEKAVVQNVFVNTVDEKGTAVVVVARKA
jgi:hypothetical protein